MIKKSAYFFVVCNNASHTIQLLYSTLQVSGSKQQTMSRSCKAEASIGLGVQSETLAETIMDRQYV
jgi:hypothetical protein